MATKEYANRVPMDMRSTRAARSNRKAIRAARRNINCDKKNASLYINCKTATT